MFCLSQSLKKQKVKSKKSYLMAGGTPNFQARIYPCYPASFFPNFKSKKLQAKLYDIANFAMVLAIIALLCVGCEAEKRVHQKHQKRNQVTVAEARQSIVEVHGAIRTCTCVIGATPECECEEVEK